MSQKKGKGGNMPNHRKYAVVVIPSRGFNTSEYETVREMLEDAGVDIFTASDTTLDATGDDGTIITVDADLAILDVAKYDMMVLIGGPGTLSCLNKPIMYQLLKDARDMGIVYGAIGIAVRILAYADCLVGKKATGLDTDKELKEILEAYGARYRAVDVVADGGVVTGSGTDDAETFAQALIDALEKQEKGVTEDPVNKRW